MHPVPPGRHWIRDTLAGGTGAITVLPVLLTLGLLVSSPFGALAPPFALQAAFVTASVGSLVHVLLSRTVMPSSGPSSATSLTFANLIVLLIADPRLTPASAAGLHGIFALCGLSVLLSGALQIVFALLGLARLARVVPQPVLAGFMNSAALLVLLAQVPLLLDLPPGTRPDLSRLQAAHAVPLALGLGTAGVIWVLATRWPRLPASLLGLLAGTTVYALISTLAGPWAVGNLIGALPSALPWPPAVLPLLGPDGLTLLRSHAGPVALTVLALATIGALETSLNARSIDQLLNARHDPRRELIALGCANIVCGLCGALPLAYTRGRAVAILQAGGRGRVAALAGPVATGLLYVLGGPVMALLPLSVLAGVMLMVAVGLADRWSGLLLRRWWAGDRSRDMAMSLGVVALVVGTTVWKGMAAGIGLGVLLSLMAFASRMNRSLVHDRYTASTRPSRRIYPASVEARLQPLRAGITVFELDGALFFGSSDRLLDETDALDAGCRHLVLDMRRVNAVDESGAVALQQVAARLGARNIQLDLAGMIDGTAAAQALRSYGIRLPSWPDADRAVESAELRLLNEGDVRAMAEVPLDESALLSGLDAEQIACVVAHLQRRHLLVGEVLFAEGEPGDRLYVVTKGSVSALSRLDKSGRTQRFASVSPGMIIGETAMLDGAGRSASAVADAPATVYALTLDALDALGRTHPSVASRLNRNLAVHLSQRLRTASGAWRSSAR